MSRAPGDHGTAQDAIDFILDNEGRIAPGEETVFLRGWNEGALDEWPEFYDWLAVREAREAPAPDLLVVAKEFATCGMRTANDPRFERLDAAIAKAEGRA
jgi:hypothetical protein